MKKIAIVGAGGVEGKSAFAYYRAMPDVEIAVHDQNPLELKDYPDATIVTGPDYLTDLERYDLVVHSPGIRPDKLGVDPAKVTTATREFFAHCPAPIIGITGTKGKGTTSSLITKFLEAAGHKVWLVGNIGQPCLDVLAQIKKTDWVVFELSSFQLFDIDKSPHIAVHLMISSDHQDWHTDMAEYSSAKANIFRFQHGEDTAVYYAGSQQVVKAAQQSPAKTKTPYDRNQVLADGAYVKNDSIMMRDKEVAKVSDVALVGSHMLDNVCAAIAATWDIVQNVEVYQKTLRSFTGLPHRMQLVRELHGVAYVDDSYSSTPAAAEAAVAAFDQPLVAILGGYNKHNQSGDFDKLAEGVKRANVRHVLLVGETASDIKAALDKIGFSDYSPGFASMGEIVEAAAKHAKSGDVVLLSPGCASFDMFRNFTDRGEQFMAAVQALS